jgi:hypothetical protein
MGKVRVTMEIVFDYDTETNMQIPISQRTKKIEHDRKEEPKTKKNKTTDTQDNFGVIRENGKLILSDETVSLLNVEPDDRIFIGYDKVGSTFKPFIGLDEKKGNKLTKSNTVSYRGKSNDELAHYGDNFTLSPGKHNGTFYLTDKNKNIPDNILLDGVEVNEDDISDDLPFSLDLDDTHAKKITSFTFDDIDLE